MSNDTEAVARSSRNPGALDQTDRILLAACAAAWLVALGAAVAAIVALVDLVTSDVGTSAEAETPWLLYTVIGVSALVIVGAVPLLIRARREAQSGEVAPPVEERSEDSGKAFGDPVETANVRASDRPVIRREPPAPPARSRVGFPTAAVEQIWLRCPTVIVGAVGAATAAVGVATYLSATEHDASAWVAYGIAGLIVVAMPAAPVLFLRQLRALLEA